MAASAKRSVTRKSSFLRYAVEWPAGTHPAMIELTMISKLGYLEFRGRKCGNGLAYHVKEFMKLAWPDMDWHRWTNLIVDEFLRSPGRTACFGPASSGKSFVFSRCALTMFYARPKGTTVLISSTTRDSLTRRIWDYVVSSHVEAKRRLSFLPGSLIESKLMLLADSKEEEGRSFKDGIVGVACKVSGQFRGMDTYIGCKNEIMMLICDECFVGGTPIDTPSGPIEIQNIKVGDTVFNATGTGRVVAISKRNPKSLVRIKTSDGRAMVCTPNHPIFTQKGWKKACELSESHFIVGTHEAMRILLKPNPGPFAFLQQKLRAEVSKSCGMEATIEKESGETAVLVLQNAESHGNVEQVLQSELLYKAPARKAWIQGKPKREAVSRHEGSACEKPSVGSPSFRVNVQSKSDGSEIGCGKSSQEVDRDWAPSKNSRRERHWANESRIHFDVLFPGGNKQLPGSDWNEKWQRLPNVLQAGFRVSKFKARRGSGRGVPQQPDKKISRSEKGPVLRGSWVESVEVFKPEDFFRDRPSGERGFVYNLQVEGHPSYSVNGFLVHNCQFMPMGFLDALANLESNENCYAAIMGNLPDVHNPLGYAAEPKMGWDALPDTDKTRVYETKWKNGRCIQFIGLDSPNLDYPEGQEPFKNLIGRRYIEQCAQNYGRESDKFNMFASGKIPRASMMRTVFTKAQATKFRAMEGVTWGHRPLERGYCLDVAYSGVGGDRTVGRVFLFGLDIENKWRVWFGPKKIYSGSTDPKKSHAEAIADEVKIECESHGVPPEHLFYDGTGRSEFTLAVARAWSTKVVSLEFGGMATERISFTGEKHLHGDNQGERKTCKESFDRFVSELWFAVAYGIFSDQVRGLDEETVDEMCQRKWEMVRGSKQSIETKEDMKERGLRSPDLGDCVVVGMEGARRLGFPLGRDAVPSKARTSQWLKREHDNQWDKLKRQQLEAA